MLILLCKLIVLWCGIIKVLFVLVRNSMLLIVWVRCFSFVVLVIRIFLYFFSVWVLVKEICVCVRRLVIGVWSLCVKFEEKFDSWVNVFLRCVSIVFNVFIKLINFWGMFFVERCWFKCWVVMWVVFVWIFLRGVILW